MSGPLGTVRSMVEAGRGILAADEGIGTMCARLAPAAARATAAGLAGPGDRTVLVADDGPVALSARPAAAGAAAAEDARQEFLRLIVTTPGLADAVCAILLAPDALAATLADGRPVPEALRALGVLPGVTAGSCAGAGLDDRVAGWAARGAAFARCRITVPGATPTALPPTWRAAARDAAAFARTCQAAGILPLIEVDVLPSRTPALRAGATGLVAGALAAVLGAASDAGADAAAVVLGIGMGAGDGATTGRGCPHPDAARRTVEALRSSVPDGVGAVALLPGRGAATHSMACRAAVRRFPAPWPVAVVGDRSALAAALRTWRGSAARRPAAQAVLAGELAWGVAALRYGMSRPNPA